MKETARIDKWLWAARIYKTRSIAADACKNGRVTVGGVNRKPSYMIKRGDVVSVKKAPITIVKRSVIFKFKRTKRMGNTLISV